ncbi:hypothetical protein [Kluyvera ascorbata]
MSTKASVARKEQQNQKAELRREQVKQAVSEMGKAQLREMRKLAFAPRKGVVTQKHFERYPYASAGTLVFFSSGVDSDGYFGATQIYYL